MVRARGCQQRPVLAQIGSDAKCRKITAVLKLLTLKAAIVQKIVEAEDDFAPALRGQAMLYDDVRMLLDDPETKVLTSAPVVEGDHGRLETGTATIFHRPLRTPETTCLARTGGYRQVVRIRRSGQYHV